VVPVTAQTHRADRIGGPDAVLSDDEIRTFIQEKLSGIPLDGRSVCVLVPDGTRSCPLPLLLSTVHGALHGRVSRLTVLVALGTHGDMSPHLRGLPGRPPDRDRSHRQLPQAGLVQGARQGILRRGRTVHSHHESGHRHGHQYPGVPRGPPTQPLR
jgi:hypothetical protein